MQFEKIGLFFVSASLFLSPFIVFLALPPFHIGVWFQSEPVIAGLHAVSMVASFGLLVLISSDTRGYLRIICHPLVLFPAALGIWSILISPFANVPMLSFLGDPRQGEGAAWYFDLASLIACGMILHETRTTRRRIAWVSLIAASACAVLTIYGTLFRHGWPWAPYWFPDYLAFYGIFTAIILITYIQPCSVFGNMACLATGFILTAFSGNRASIVLCLILVPAVWGIFRHLKQNALVRFYAAGLIIAVPILISVGITLYGAYLGRIHPKGWTGADSLSSRSLQNRVIFLSFQDKPCALITGYGWGHYTDQLTAYANQKSVPLTAEGPDRLDSLDREYFHSHNGFAEAILSTGIIGLFLMWAILIALPCCCGDSQIPLAGTSAALIGGLSSVWFQLPGSVPFMAMALAGFRKPSADPESKPGIIAAVVVFSGLIAIFFIQAYAFGLIWHQGIKVRDKVLAHSDIASAEFHDLVACAGPGGVHFTRIFLKVAAKERNNQPGSGNDALFAFLDAHEYLLASSRKMSLRFYNSGLLVRGQLAFSLTHPSFAQRTRKYMANWGERLGFFLDRAPRRTDMAALYLLWLFREGEEQKMLGFANRILEKDPEDPVGLWFSGLAMAAGPGDEKDKGIARLKRSLDLGIERILPLDPGIRDQINSKFQ